jgi:hypothetical protein
MLYGNTRRGSIECVGKEEDLDDFERLLRSEALSNIDFIKVDLFM